MELFEACKRFPRAKDFISNAAKARRTVQRSFGLEHGDFPTEWTIGLESLRTCLVPSCAVVMIKRSGFQAGWNDGSKLP
jgi:hypothetical protein